MLRKDKMKIIITDLTRFSKKKDDVCIAGINPDTNECIRPPYPSKENCRELNILPGAIIEGNFTPRSCTDPHTEDRNGSQLKFIGPCSLEEFRKLLNDTSVHSVEEGFGIQLPDGQKHIPHDAPPNVSIITLCLHPNQLKIVKDGYNAGKLRVNFTDRRGKTFRFLPITDLGFCEYAERHLADNIVDHLNTFIHSQQELYIRLGLGRIHQSKDGRNGFWLQVNGIYTFPEYLKKIRCHVQQ